MKDFLFFCDDEIAIRFKVGTKVYAHSISRVGFEILKLSKDGLNHLLLVVISRISP